MKKKSRHKWLIAITLLVCILLFSLQGGIYHFLESKGARFVSPTFLDITMIRLQRIHKLQGDAVILGSSITERLMASPSTAVVGVPSSSFIAGLHLINQSKRFPNGTTYILEVNNLFNGVYQPVLNDAEKWSFQYFRNSRNFSIAAKPTSLILSLIYHYKMSGNPTRMDPKPFARQVQPENIVHTDTPSIQELEEWGDIMAGIEQIKSQGGRICLVQFPTRNPHEFDKSFANASKLAKHFNIPILNYNTDEWRSQLTFTDSRHLDSKAPSTGRFRETIVRDAKACAR